MATQHDDHTLNACLARVIEKEIDLCWNEQTKRNEIPYCHYGSMEWNPVHDANQMELVEAWLRENGYNYDYHWWSSFKDHHYNIYHVEKVRGIKGWQGKDPDKKRAFALAIWEMEQSQKGGIGEDIL